jgi:glycine/D-amino acid oxidase-like deaminating enzyme
LKSKLNSLINCNYNIISHLAGVRPSSIDRRPIIGAHPEYKNLFVFNGLGTKGVMLAPYFSENFVNFYLKNEPLMDDVNVKRFYSNYAG